MLTYEEQEKLLQLTKSNADFNEIITRIAEENRLILSRFTHELRNPLTLIKSTVQYINQKHPETSEFKYWNELSQDIDDTINLLNKLSIYNHCDSLSLEQTNLKQLLEQCIESFRPLADKKEISFHFIYDKTLDTNSFTYSCDRIKIKQVLTNLIKNALEASEEKKAIEVNMGRIFSKDNNVSFLRITVTNEGCISEDIKDTIFEPFISTKSTGTGLGLSISKRIIQHHHGKMNVLCDGTHVTFEINLPL